MIARSVVRLIHLGSTRDTEPMSATLTPDLLHRMDAWSSCVAATGGRPLSWEGSEPAVMHEAMAAALDAAIEQVKGIRQNARTRGDLTRPRWPMIVLSHPRHGRDRNPARSPDGPSGVRRVRSDRVRSCEWNGEAGGNRTLYPQIKSLLLCQLSYRPTGRGTTR
jgi:hypothetical protein